MHDDLPQLLRELVSIPSVNPMGQPTETLVAAQSSLDARSLYGSRAVLDHIESWLRSRGVATRRQPVPGGDENLIATVPGRPGGRTILFDAHTDTVPADDWTERAFSPRIESGRLYGRGACDTKGSLAAMMWALAHAARASTPPHQLVLLASADEEYARTGVRTYLASQPAPDAAVVGEPTRCLPVIACKGAARWEITVAGRSAHTSMPHDGVNAINRMAQLIGLLQEYERTILSTRRHPLTDAGTLTVSMIQGGIAVNVVPPLCRITIDLRTLPGEDPGEARAGVQAFLAERCDFPIEHGPAQLWNGADTAADHPFVRHCVSCCRIGTPNRRIAPKGVNFGCHAADYAALGIPAVVLGPGDISAAHAIDEFVPLDDLIRAAEIYFRIMTTEW